MDISYKSLCIARSLIFLAVILTVAILTGCTASQVSPAPGSVLSPTFTAATFSQTNTPSLRPVSSPSPFMTPTNPSATSAPSLTASPGPGPTLTPSVNPSATPTPPPLPAFTPPATPFKPSGTLADLFDYMLKLINQDRQSAGLNPVTLSYNAAAQKHAQDMFDNFFLSHWGTNGLKPYMRYTLEGGVDYEQENSAYSGWYDRTENPGYYAPLDIRQELKDLQAAMMAEVYPNDGHRQNILNPWHTRVNLGIVYDTKRVALVQQFEGDYVEFINPPILSGNVLSLSGRFIQSSLEFNNISVYYDPEPQVLSQDQLLHVLPDHYGLGNSDPPGVINYVLPPPPPGQFYSSLPPQAILAMRWDIGPSGQFSIQADISPALNHGKGVYTLALIVKLGIEPQNVTNYSLFVE